MLKKLLVAAMMISFAAGAVFAQEKAAEPAKKVEKTMSKNPIVELKTNQGSIYLEVFEKETPVHARNFLTKVDAGKYDNLTFHRIVKDFVIQGGDPTGTGSGSMGGEPLADEKSSPYPQVRGTVAMARSPQGASDCQFYINLKDNSFLDRQKFTSFARVVQGMDVADKIATVQTGPGDKPIQPVIMLKVYRVDKLPSAAPAAPAMKSSEEKK